MSRVMVLGSGYMGSGIAQVFAAGGHQVLLWDITEQLCEKGIRKINDGLEARIIKGKETEEHKCELMSRIEYTCNLEKADTADLIIEVVVENAEIKKEVLKKAEAFSSGNAIIASNTSYIPITELASVLEKPENFLGMHFFGPVQAMRLVELTSGKKTKPETVEKAKEFAISAGKTPVVVKKDSPGFIVNRINAAIRMEAFRCYEEGIASIEDIDTAMKLGLNHPMGPFELNDLAGLEIGLSGLDTLYEKTGEERWKADGKVRELVSAGELGRKTGKGWYDYTSGQKVAREDL